MAKPARYARMSHYGDYASVSELADAAALTPGPRIAPPPDRHRGGASLAVIVICLLGVGGAWAMFGDPATWPERVGNFLDAAQSPAPAAPTQVAAAHPPAQATERAQDEIATASITKSVEPSPAPLPAAPEPTAAKAVETEPAPAPAVAVTPREAPPATVSQPEPPQPLPEVVATEPWQKRAVAAGLHPDLSRALLERLSTVDYRNASYAVRTALTETPDGQVFAWPREARKQLAVFQVKFVEGAPAGCRRYVVTISRDGWSTTALPMEKCGIKLRQSAANQGAGNKAVVRPINQ